MKPFEEISGWVTKRIPRSRERGILMGLSHPNRIITTSYELGNPPSSKCCPRKSFA